MNFLRTFAGLVVVGPVVLGAISLLGCSHAGYPKHTDLFGHCGPTACAPGEHIIYSGQGR